MKNLSDIQALQQFDNIELIANQIVEGFITGLHRSPFHGFSVEFAEHRIYNTGESTKHIDWKLYARTEKLFVKRYEEETNLRARIVIDTSSSMLFPFRDKKRASKLAFAIYCSAALIFLLRKQRDAVGLSLFSDHLELQTDAKLSNVHAQRLFAELDKLLSAPRQEELKKQTSAAQSLHQIAESIHKRSLVIVFSDMLENAPPEDVFNALQHLRHNKHEVIVFHVTDKKYEQEFQYSNRPYRFIDMETGQEMKLQPNEIREHYVQSVKKYFNELKLKCAQYQIDLVEADINRDFRNVLTPYLVKRKKLF